MATWFDAEGLREQGRSAIEEAVSLYRELARTHPGAYVIELGQALDRNGAILRRLDRRHEALAVWHEAALWYMTLEADPQAELSLGRTFSEMATCLYELGDCEKALDNLRRAEIVQKVLIPTQPGWALADLATTLSRALLILDHVGEREHALELTQHLVKVRKQLVTVMPHYLPDLGVSLIDLGRRLDELGQHDKASGIMREAAMLRSRLVMMAAHWPFWLELQSADRVGRQI